MANIYAAKDNHSFYLLNLFNSGDQITYDWSLSKSYSMIVGKGAVSIGSENRSAVGVHNISPGTQITMNANVESIAFCCFLLNDNAVMQELFPTASTLTQVKGSDSHLIEIEDVLSMEKITPELSFSEEWAVSSPITFSLSDLESKVLGALSS